MPQNHSSLKGDTRSPRPSQSSKAGKARGPWSTSRAAEWSSGCSRVWTMAGFCCTGAGRSSRGRVTGTRIPARPEPRPEPRPRPARRQPRPRPRPAAVRTTGCAGCSGCSRWRLSFLEQRKRRFGRPPTTLKGFVLELTLTWAEARSLRRRLEYSRRTAWFCSTWRSCWRSWRSRASVASSEWWSRECSASSVFVLKDASQFSPAVQRNMRFLLAAFFSSFRGFWGSTAATGLGSGLHSVDEGASTEKPHGQLTAKTDMLAAQFGQFHCELLAGAGVVKGAAFMAGAGASKTSSQLKSELSANSWLLSSRSSPIMGNVSRSSSKDAKRRSSAPRTSADILNGCVRMCVKALLSEFF
mmetsp:Transcript_9208/g.13409  ORF Transcript_9208/g.13409 Transcript_9208/m.13409 type:complete len:356 (+) Transcript_9208:214-1281(+)